MGEYIEYSAKNKSEAITKAVVDLGVSSDQLDIQVVSEGSSGFFGFGSKPAIIRVRKISGEDTTDKEIRKIVEEVSTGSLNRGEETKGKKEKKATVKQDASEKDAQESGKAKEKNNQPKQKKEKSPKQDKAKKPEKVKTEAEKETGSDVVSSAEKESKKQDGKSSEGKVKEENKKTRQKRDRDGNRKSKNSASAEGSLEVSEPVDVSAFEREAALKSKESYQKDEDTEEKEGSEEEESVYAKRRREYREWNSRSSRGGKYRDKYSSRGYRDVKEEAAGEESESSEAENAEDEQITPTHVSRPVKILEDETLIAEVEKRAKDFLTNVFACMDLGEVTIQSVYNKEEGSLDVDFEGEDMGVLIGKRGQTLDSMQYLTSLVVNKGLEDYVRVKLDTEDYRRRRKETLENLARGIAYKVRKTHRTVVLEPMNPYERRIIHSSLQGNRYVETFSEGEEPYRHVVIRAKRF